MDIWDHEGNAAAIYAEAKIDPSEPPGPHALLRALGIRLRRDWRPSGSDGYYQRAIGDLPETVWVRPRLHPIHEAWIIYHELAERHLRDEHGDEAKERACDSLAAALRAPRPAFLAFAREVGLDLRELAAAFVTSQTSAALRYAEVVGTPLVVVTPRIVYRRGEWGWPADAELRRLAKTGADGLRREPLTDARARVALVGG